MILPELLELLEKISEKINDPYTKSFFSDPLREDIFDDLSAKRLDTWCREKNMLMY